MVTKEIVILGAGFAGERLNTLYKEMLDEDQILTELSRIIGFYADERNKDERFGDFIIRKEIIAPSQEVTVV